MINGFHMNRTVPYLLTDGVKKQKSSLLLIVEGYCQVRVYHTVHVTFGDPKPKRTMKCVNKANR